MFSNPQCELSWSRGLLVIFVMQEASTKQSSACPYDQQ